MDNKNIARNDLDSAVVTDNPWSSLRRFTAARIALGAAGVSLPTAPQMAFQLAHAMARDAVHLALDVDMLRQELSAPAEDGGTGFRCIELHSAAINRQTYLQRPDLGRRLHPESRNTLLSMQAEQKSDAAPYDVALVIADGLSSLAIQRNAAPFIRTLIARLVPDNWSVAPVTIVRQGRVAIGDEVGELLGARCVVVLIGERPGLSSPDSMGIYMTWAPRVGLTDANRNCISNIRPGGLSYDDAVYRLHYLLSEARRLQYSGVELKDETSLASDNAIAGSSSFLLED